MRATSKAWAVTILSSDVKMRWGQWWAPPKRRERVMGGGSIFFEATEVLYAGTVRG